MNEKRIRDRSFDDRPSKNRARTRGHPRVRTQRVEPFDERRVKREPKKKRTYETGNMHRKSPQRRENRAYNRPTRYEQDYYEEDLRRGDAAYYEDQDAYYYYENNSVARPRSPNRNARRKKNEYRWEEERKKEQKKRGSLVWSFLYNLFFYIFTIGLLVAAVMFAFSSQDDRSLFGYRFYNVLTNSMAPVDENQKGGFLAGDMTFVKMATSSEVKKGDIITYRIGDGNRYLTHRLIGKLTELNGQKGDYIVTQGDANEVADPPFEGERVLGKVLFSVPKMGLILEFVRGNIILCGVFLVALFGFFLVIKAYFIH